MPDFAHDKKQYWAILLSILAAGILLRILSISLIPTNPVSDFWSYFQRASSLVDRGVYEAIEGRPDASYPPGYPLFLSLFFHLPFDRLLVAKIVNALLSCASIILAAEIARRIFGHTAALISGVIMAVNPRAILTCNLIASENLFIPLLLVFILLAIQNRAGIMHTIFTGAVIGLAALTRSVAWMLFLPWLIFQIANRMNIRKVLVNSLVLICAQLIVMLPWAIRNGKVLRHFSFLTTTSGINLFIGNNPNASGSWYYWPEDVKRVVPDFDQFSVVDQNVIAGIAARQWMAGHPLGALKLYCQKWELLFENDHFALDMAVFAKEVSPPWPSGDVLDDTSQFLPYQRQLNITMDVFYWTFLVLGVGGAIFSIVRNFKKRQLLSQTVFIFVSAAYFPAVSAIYLASTRFHWPAADLLILFAGGLLAFLFARKDVKLLSDSRTG